MSNGTRPLSWNLSFQQSTDNIVIIVLDMNVAGRVCETITPKKLLKIKKLLVLESNVEHLTLPTEPAISITFKFSAKKLYIYGSKS